MAATIDSSGDIEVICDTTNLGPNKMARLVFRVWEGTDPPFKLQIRSPRGKLILDRVVRHLPTSDPQSPPAIAFQVQAGEYTIEISELRGSAEGVAMLNVIAD